MFKYLIVNTIITNAIISTHNKNTKNFHDVYYFDTLKRYYSVKNRKP